MMLTLKTVNFIQQILVTCSTTYSNGNHNNILLNNHSNVFSVEPSKLLKTLPTPPGNCANLVLDSHNEYHQSLSLVDQNRFKVKIVVIHSNISKYKRELEKHQPSYEVHLVQLANETIQGYYWHSPIGSDGRAVSRHVTVSYTIFRPYVFKKGQLLEGSDVDTMRELSESQGFTVKFTPATSFSQLVRLIANRTADMSVSNAAGDLHRYRLGIDLFALMYRRYVFVYRNPIPIHYMYTFTLPFTLLVWIGILASILGIMVTLALLNKWYGSKKWMHLSDMSLSYVPLISISVPHYWYNNHVKKMSYYIIYFIWLLFGTVLSMSYSSNLLANLVKVELEFQPKTLQDVLDMKVGVYLLKNSVMPEFLRESRLELHQKIISEAVGKRGGFYTGSVLPPEEITEKILSGQYMAGMADDSQAVFKHKFSMVKEEVFSGPCGYYFRPNLPIKDEIIGGLMRWRDTGVIQKIISRANWKLSLPWRNLQRTKPDNEVVVIGLTHLVPLGIFITVGLGQSLISVVFEMKISGMSKQACRDIAVVNKFVTLVAKNLHNYVAIIYVNIKGIPVSVSRMKSNCKRSDNVVVLSTND